MQILVKLCARTTHVYTIEQAMPMQKLSKFGTCPFLNFNNAVHVQSCNNYRTRATLYYKRVCWKKVFRGFPNFQTFKMDEH